MPELVILGDEPPDAKATTRQSRLTINYTASDIFHSSSSVIIAHACNCLGHWGRGIALEIKKLYPMHFQKFKEYCRERREDDLVGTCLLIGPTQRVARCEDTRKCELDHWIACLFTKRGTGRFNHTPSESMQAEILSHTKCAMQMLLRQLRWLHETGQMVTELHMPKINSGLFGVPWARTVAQLQQAVDESDVQQLSIIVHEWKLALETDDPGYW